MLGRSAAGMVSGMNKELYMEAKYSMEEFLEIIKKLRSKDGCPWDREQTHESLRQCMIEEAYEAAESIDIYKEEGSWENMQEELGDVLLLVVMQSRIAEEEGIFDFSDVVDGISAKMIRRHPHVFGEKKAEEAGEVIKLWEDVKAEEKKDKKPSAIPRSFPALMKAEKLWKQQKRLDTAGGSLKNIESAVNILDKVREVSEKGITEPDEEGLGAAMGELLFTIVKIVSAMGIRAEDALNQFVKSNEAGREYE